MSKIILKVISPEGVIYENDIDSINIKTSAGYLTILPKHFPLVSSCKASICHFYDDDQIIKAFVGDGVIRVSETSVELIVSSFNFKEQIDIERAKKALERAKNYLASNDPNIDKKRAQHALIRAEARIALWEDQ